MSDPQHIDDFASHFLEALRANPNILGAGDIFCRADQGNAVRAGDIFGPLTSLLFASGAPLIQHYRVILPAGTDLDDFRAELVNATWSAFERSVGRPPEDGNRSAFDASLSLVHSTNRQSASLLEALRQTPMRSAVFVVDAGSYRDEDTQPYIAPGNSFPLLVEDIWAPQIVSLANAALPTLQERELYLTLDAGTHLPHQPAMQDLLDTIGAFGLYGSEMVDDPDAVLAANVARWTSSARAGDLGSVIREVTDAAGLAKADKALIGIQLMHLAGATLQALANIREIMVSEPSLPTSVRVKLAQIAAKGGASRLTVELLEPVISELESREHLEVALSTADEAGRTDIAQRIADRLRQDFPASEELFDHDILQAVRRRDYGTAAKRLATHADKERDADYYGLLAAAFDQAVPDYVALLDRACGDRPLRDRLQSAAVADARHRKLYLHAFDLALPLPMEARARTRVAALLLETIEDLILHAGPDGKPAVELDLLIGATGALLDKLASDPNDHGLREKMVKVFGPTVAGAMGRIILLMTLQRSLGSPLDLIGGPDIEDFPLARWEEYKPFTERAFAWMAENEMLLVGKMALPSALCPPSPDGMVSLVLKMIQRFGEAGEAADHMTLMKFLTLGCALAPHCKDQNRDLALLRLTATTLASGSQRQLARDLAQQMIEDGHSPRRRRLGWSGMADVYNRCGSHLEALVAMNCAWRSDSEVDPEQRWQDVTAVIRILRDLDFTDEALELMGAARDALDALGQLERSGHRLDYLEVQVEQARLLARPGFTNDDLRGLIIKVARVADKVLAAGDTVAPISVMLGQLLRLAADRRLAISADVQATMAGLQGGSHGVLSDIVEIFSATAPTPEILLRLSMATGQARYSDDVGFDSQQTAVAAAQALTDDALLADSDPDRCAFVLALKADRGVALPNWDEAATPPPPPETIAEPGFQARALSLRGASIVLTGIDASGSLVRQFAIGGELEPAVREKRELFHGARLRAWSSHYPFDYGTDETTANLFHVTTDDLRLETLPEGPIILIADSEMHSFPPNLLREGYGFAGAGRPVAAAPSLAWLAGADAIGAIGDGRHCVWISNAEREGESRTLPMIIDRLDETFELNGFDRDHGPVVPHHLAGAELVVIAAHGSIHPDGRNFQRVADEGALRVTADDLARNLRNVGVVILFVCSGGRFDKVGNANTTHGLAKQILDRGCGAVIASPWPLDARVPSHWLPAFLDHWKTGADLMTATFEANRKVGRAFSEDIARALAMTVYGNPFLRSARA